MKDFILNEDETLKITKGDFTAEDSLNQEEKLILMANKGDYREFPDLGVGIGSFVDSELGSLYKLIIENMELDEKEIKSLDIYENGNINLTTKRK
ncbi:hypothetical protein MY04_4804 [Flammeovirga sp. MY04]|uniref:hypothetical protein n=1 Tax=Flammeovirga sp. MY04 TaxID=1191459 RepID=UPI000806405D|nr:hypothetical protein [Flammeovirga sp. MY04]ANQ49621.1 hypothetical protein MY04_2247 [Flammeovirga sp. MY04]ANQ52139.1 hypothetical protein MY04_4804 [Flammeovirga sp. MY04]